MTPETDTEARPATVDETRLAHLEQLGNTLTLRGWSTAVARPSGGPPFLRVTNPDLTLLTDTVFCCLAADGTWQYRWRWDALIASTDDLAGAAEKVTRVLGAGEL